jgi:cell division septal protein FtsQ
VKLRKTCLREREKEREREAIQLKTFVYTAMRIVIPIAFGLAIVVCSVLCFYCWRIQRARKNLSSIQVSAIPDESLHVSKFLV